LADTSKTGSSGRPVAAAVTAMDRFEKILQQTAMGRSNGQDLRVRLDVGNNESVVVAMKDLGGAIAVEVKASHQGLVSLLQAQKDAIVRHLEGKDLRTNIYIDPNASGTPDRRQQRDARRGPFEQSRRDAAAAGTFPEMFA
jgi:hypothetical protein